MEWVTYGPNALLFRFAAELGDEAFAKGRAIAEELERAAPPGMIEYVQAFTTILITFQTAEQRASAAAPLARRFEQCARNTIQDRPVHDIRVVYDGADLKRVAESHDLRPEEVVEIHSATTYKVYMLGFSPGFPYLGDLDPRLHTTRLATPRVRVAAGSVAIGGPHTGIYSVDGPGGWNIIGHTDVKVFDPTAPANRMFLLRPGDRVRFTPQRP